jgi:hypothetical protein
MSWFNEVGDLLQRYKGASAQHDSPEVVSQLADHAAKHDPSIIDRAGEVYAQHPTLVKSLGVGALTVIMSHLSQRH